MMTITLNRSTTNGYLNGICDENHKFISRDSKDLLRIYADDNHRTREKTIELWANLLIDAITILKINDSREKIYDDFKTNLSHLREFETILSDIRKTSSYGIEGLRKYLADFVEFESLLYGADNHYRDHINHVIQVWAIGVLLLEKDGNHFALNDGYKEDKNTVFHFQITESGDMQLSKSEIWAMWTIIALCHDLGYPIEQSSKINEKTKQIIRHFGSVQFTEMEYNFSILSTFLVEKFLNIISSKVVEIQNTMADKSYETSIQTKFKDKFSKSLEDYKHGIFSSLLLFKDLTYFLETDYFVKEPLKAEDARQFYIRKEILRSIASHTCHKLYHINLNTLSFLLILCDELQEWDRPIFENIINYHGGNEPTVCISLELPIRSSGSRNIQKMHIKMDYEINNITDSNEKYLVEKRFRHINYLLRSANDDDKRQIDFKWIINLGSYNYEYSYNYNNEPFKRLSITKNGEKFDIYKS